MASNKPKLGRIEESVITTILYHDIFDFPLTKKEIWRFLIAEKGVKQTEVSESFKKLDSNILLKSNYIALAGREEIINRRRDNLDYVNLKLDIAKKAAKALSAIPTVLFIGISGGLAINDAGKNDDIDFFIITKKNTIFKTRLLVLIILQFLGLRRKRIEKNPADKICVNFFIDETKLFFPENKQDIYTAHEIAQLKPMFERNKTYSKFLRKNKWVLSFLPNSHASYKGEITGAGSKSLLRFFAYFMEIFISERFSRVLQIGMMKRHIKNETVTNHILAFNPNDYRAQALKKLRLKLREIGLLTSY